MKAQTENVLKVEVKASLDDFIDANRLVHISCSVFDALFRHAVLIASFYFLMMMATDVSKEGITFSSTARHLLTALIVGPILGVFTIALLWLVMPLIARREFTKRTVNGEKMSYTFGSEGIQAKGESFETKVDWSTTYDFLQSKKVLLIRLSKTGFFLLPKSQIGERSLDAIIALLKDNQVKGPFPK